MKKLDRSDVEPLRLMVKYMIEHREYTLAAEILQSLNDMRALVAMHITALQWTDVCVYLQ